MLVQAIAEALTDSARLSPTESASNDNCRRAEPKPQKSQQPVRSLPLGQSQAGSPQQKPAPPPRQEEAAAAQPPSAQKRPSVPGNMASVFGGIEWRPNSVTAPKPESGKPYSQKITML